MSFGTRFCQTVAVGWKLCVVRATGVNEYVYLASLIPIVRKMTRRINNFISNKAFTRLPIVFFAQEFGQPP